MHWCPIKHPNLASCKCFDRSSTYTANKRGDKMPSCQTPCETVQKLDVDWPYLMHISCLLYQKINILTISNEIFLTISLLKVSNDLHDQMPWMHLKNKSILECFVEYNT